jgi:periplasmic protein TonB
MSTHTAERRPLGALGRMGVVTGLHAGVLYLIANSLGLVPAITENKTEATFIDERRPTEDPIPTTDPVLEPRETLVLPEEPPPLQYEQETVLAEQPPDPIERQDHTGDGSAVVQPRIVGVQLDSRHPLSQPPYPPSDIRAGNTGTADIEIYVLPDGRVGDARIVKSTGFPALDQSALDEARRRWRLTPATRDGVPFAQWHRLRVTFKLNQQR